MLKNLVIAGTAVAVVGYVAVKVADYLVEDKKAVETVYDQINHGNSPIKTTFGYTGKKCDNIGIVASDKILKQYNLLDSMAMSLGDGNYMIVIAEDLYMRYTYDGVKATVYHEIGHIVNGDLDDNERAKELRRARIKEDPSMLNVATMAEVNADHFAANHVGCAATLGMLHCLENHVAHYYCDHKIARKLNDNKSINEIDIRIDYIRAMYAEERSNIKKDIDIA